MVGNSKDIWQKRLDRQEFPLIEGNGINDQIVKPRGYQRQNTDAESDKYYNNLFSVYFRDLANRLIPYRGEVERNFKKSIKISGASNFYIDTFLKYLSRNDRFQPFQNLLEIWANHLCTHGRVIVEMVSWTDPTEKYFYAYSLNTLQPQFCAIINDNIKYEFPLHNGEIQTFILPKKKCIIIEWPTELGGYAKHQKIVKNILALKNPTPPTSKFLRMIANNEKIINDSPRIMYEKHMEYDRKYNKILNDWGVIHVDKDTTEYFKRLNEFKYKRTVISCHHELMEGIKAIILFLNGKLEEKAEFHFYNYKYDKKTLAFTTEMWRKGELSFKSSRYFLKYLYNS